MIRTTNVRSVWAFFACVMVALPAARAETYSVPAPSSAAAFAVVGMHPRELEPDTRGSLNVEVAAFSVSVNSRTALIFPAIARRTPALARATST